MTADASGNSADRETLECDVLIVGAGPAGLSCAIRLAELYNRGEQENDSRSATPVPSQTAFNPANIFVLEKASEVGAHCLSGALLDPRALRRLIPDFESQNPPLLSPVTADAVFYPTHWGRFKLPVTPAFLRNRGNYIISLNQFVRWLGRRAEQAGVSLFCGFAGVETLCENGRVVGVRTGDKGVDRNGHLQIQLPTGI